MKYLLTGGAGFIGSHLADALLTKGDEVSCIDDLSTGGMENIRHLIGQPGFEFVIESVLNKPIMAELVDEADVVLHLAAAVGVRLIVESPIRTIETNIKGMEVVLELAAKKGRPVAVFSTSEVYGKSSGGQSSETNDLILGPTIRGRWSYAASKIIDEFLALAYHKEKKLPVIVFRLFNTVGPRQTGRYGMVLPRFVQQALAGDPITVFGNGKQTRTFAHVKDVVWAIIRLVEHSMTLGEIYNIGGKEEISIDRLAHRVKDVLRSPSRIVYIPYEDAYNQEFDDIQSRMPDIHKIRALIGYEPKWTLEDIILDVAEFQKARQSIPRFRTSSSEARETTSPL